MTPDFSIVTKFEREIARFFGAPYCIAVDSATHGIELCLRYINADSIHCPTRTYLSVPMLANKLKVPLVWRDYEWQDYYQVSLSVFDAAVLWKPNSYIAMSMMCVSFQFQKHLPVGRLGCILLDDEKADKELRRMVYDGRERGIPWREQNISSYGFHYYAQPELAHIGLTKLPAAIKTPPRIWTSADYPLLTEMDVFKNV